MPSEDIKFIFADITIIARLRNTPTAKAIFAALPIRSSVQTWGEEIYFTTPVNVELENDAKHIVKAGEISYWVEGSCIAIGFGPTPISHNNEIRLAVATNTWADAVNDVTQLIKVKPGDSVLIEASDL